MLGVSDSSLPSCTDCLCSIFNQPQHKFSKFKSLQFFGDDCGCCCNCGHRLRIEVGSSRLSRGADGWREWFVIILLRGVVVLSFLAFCPERRAGCGVFFRSRAGARACFCVLSACLSCFLFCFFCCRLFVSALAPILEKGRGTKMPPNSIVKEGASTWRYRNLVGLSLVLRVWALVVRHAGHLVTCENCFNSFFFFLHFFLCRTL